MDIEELLTKATIARLHERTYCDIIAKAVGTKLTDKECTAKCEYDSYKGKYIITISKCHEDIGTYDILDFFIEYDEINL